MNPALFLLHALIEGAAAVATGATSPAVMEAYHDLKSLLATKSVLLPALETIERRPLVGMELTRLIQVLEQERAANDSSIMGAARRLEMELVSFRTGEIKSGARRNMVPSGPPGGDALSVVAGSKAPTDGAEYEIWYGTNRRPVDPVNAGKGYSAQRDAAVHHGSCRVLIPKSHKIGSTGSLWWKRLFTEDDRLRLREVKTLGGKDYWRAIAERLGAVDPGERHALVFVHGYNVSFEHAALQAAQIGFDLQVRGAMAFFSWPSRGRLDGYLADAATIEASEGAITDFLVDFADQAGAKAVHVIAHSMGNRGVLRAVDRIAQRAWKRSGKRFGQVILAAADVDADLFRQRAAAYVQLAQRTTLYVSTRDFAVEASHWLHDFPRVGLMPPVLVAPGIDTVNVANVDLTRLGHGYVAEARAILQDMHDLIARGAPPDRRFGLRAVETPEGGRFWVIGA